MTPPRTLRRHAARSLTPEALADLPLLSQSALDQELPQRPLPGDDGRTTIHALGRVTPDDVLIFVRQRTIGSILDHSRSNLHRMLGGVLVRHPFESDERLCVNLTAHIRAVRGRSSSVSFTFTHECWTDVVEELRLAHPGEQLIGWYVTQPGLGVFMSRASSDIHTTYFNFPYQVHLCVDPVADKLGIFAWRDRALTTCGFYVVS